MHLTIAPEMQKFIDEELRTGRYASAEDVVHAGLAALRQQEFLGDFHPGELDALWHEGEQSIAQHGTLDAESSFARRRMNRDPR